MLHFMIDWTASSFVLSLLVGEMIRVHMEG
jgi:hypothetical protein